MIRTGTHFSNTRLAAVVPPSMPPGGGLGRIHHPGPPLQKYSVSATATSRHGQPPRLRGRYHHNIGIRCLDGTCFSLRCCSYKQLYNRSAFIFVGGKQYHIAPSGGYNTARLRARDSIRRARPPLGSPVIIPPTDSRDRPTLIRDSQTAALSLARRKLSGTARTHLPTSLAHIGI